MRDIIWTVIVVWIVWKLYESFKTVSKPKAHRVYTNQQQHTRAKQEGKTTVNHSTDSKNKSHLDPNIGEYVDYEEIK